MSKLSILTLVTIVASLGNVAESFTISKPMFSPTRHEQSTTMMMMMNNEKSNNFIANSKDRALGFLLAASVFAGVLCGPPSSAYAEEFNYTLDLTGESVFICKERGPLGRCTKSTRRTKENDNDKAARYFKEPTPLVKSKDAAMRQSIDDSDGNALIQKLRQQSLDNKEKNDLAVLQRAMQNDLSASFGPFDKQVVILNTDGRTYSLLQNPQAMRLKEAGFIKDRKFVKMPTEQELDDALEAPTTSLADGLFKGILGQ
eukprot:CAMPEP_0118704728 /NCGR_PEP_ID=MMETSP0800-20121206/19420_1 /TAXON_ID=210618 ORGANISM="Striatella unipunctata, Strain CCMP2910" /NCGR_SAMPLE_ID=MMETSP0800 /ASSEMBLY_ACC=CAM_ASM_000638 /LENGTH=257 /DNA_ID=CAMNT_0006606697 /DNA_START=21 /DNA_END=794 /DNA_ORIENTATION=+